MVLRVCMCVNVRVEALASWIGVDEREKKKPAADGADPLSPPTCLYKDFFCIRPCFLTLFSLVLLLLVYFNPCQLFVMSFSQMRVASQG